MLIVNVPFIQFDGLNYVLILHHLIGIISVCIGPYTILYFAQYSKTTPLICRKTVGRKEHKANTISLAYNDIFNYIIFVDTN